ncbi:hypothetical protein GIB67_035901 [Kingdonia uniflora]|uniref:Uncharacterized protein n=1 Tax=Kingdonia uniflora TaxID=39325 RepID=A0A7J7P9F8_9MAGN|nr:hypothetical protein GIB67_035901 [Kingdonia uniflora]
MPELSNRRFGISFEDCDISHVKFPHHDALVIMLKIKKFIMHTMMIDAESGIEILFQSTIDQMGLANQVIPSDTDISGFNGSKIDKVDKIILPITAGPATIDDYGPLLDSQHGSNRFHLSSSTPLQTQ